VCVFGGSFNPPHVAHMLAASLAVGMFDMDRVLVVPTYVHPFAKSLAPYEDRVTMCELAMGWLPRVTVSRAEEELGGESLTLRLVTHLRDANAGADLFLLMGADLMVESSKWYRFDEIKKIAPPLLVGRVGVAYEGAPAPLLPDVSSTQIRARIAEGAWEEAERWLPARVLAHIRERGLYAAAS
jgi:nicotinate-nucleotide adenylyltransferase